MQTIWPPLLHLVITHTGACGPGGISCVHLIGISTRCYHPPLQLLPESVKRCKLSRLAVSPPLSPPSVLWGSVRSVRNPTHRAAITYHPPWISPPTINHPPVMGNKTRIRHVYYHWGKLDTTRQRKATPGDVENNTRNTYHPRWFLTSDTVSS